MDKFPSIFLKPREPMTKLLEIVRLKQELSEFQNVQFDDLQLCFLVDATGSMQEYVDQVRAQIESICNKIKQNMDKQSNIYLSMVAYRDRMDYTPIEKIDFTQDQNQFKHFINGLQFTGGGDECEDIKVGFKEALTLKWSPSSIKMIIWIADAPCHGQKYHSTSVSDSYLQDNSEIEDYLKLFSDGNIDLYFYKTTDLTDQMIQIFKEKSFIHDKILQQQNFHSSDLSHNIAKNFASSKSVDVFNQFFQFTKKFEGTKQLERCKQLKEITKEFIKLSLNQNSDDESDSCVNKMIGDQKVLQPIQESDIENISDVKWNEELPFDIYKLKLNTKNPNKVDIIPQDEQEIALSKEIIGQGSFKECFLGQDENKGVYYAMKRFKKQTSMDFDNLIIENIVHLIAIKIRDSFMKELKNKNIKTKKIFFDDLFIAHDTKNNQFYLMDTIKYGFLKFINNDSNTITDSNDTQSDLYQSFIHYSFQYSDYNFILADIQGFGNVLNDISIHSQNLIDNFKQKPLGQIKQQFDQKKKEIDLKDTIINTQVNSNLGDLGIILFLNRHKCNNYCEQLKLKTFQELEKSVSVEPVRGRQRQSSPSQNVKSLSRSNSARKKIEQYKQMCM